MRIACGIVGLINASVRELTCGALMIGAAGTSQPTRVITSIRCRTHSTWRSMSKDRAFSISRATITGTAVRGITKSMAWTISCRSRSSANPLQPVADSVFKPARLFPNPLTWTWSLTKGADLMWVPISFEKSFRMAYTRTRYGTGYYIFHQYVRGANLSQPIRAWDGQTPPDPAVLDLIRRSGTD